MGVDALAHPWPNALLLFFYSNSMLFIITERIWSPRNTDGSKLAREIVAGGDSPITVRCTIRLGPSRCTGTSSHKRAGRSFTQPQIKWLSGHRPWEVSTWELRVCLRGWLRRFSFTALCVWSEMECVWALVHTHCSRSLFCLQVCYVFCRNF